MESAEPGSLTDRPLLVALIAGVPVVATMVIIAVILAGSNSQSNSESDSQSSSQPTTVPALVQGTDGSAGRSESGPITYNPVVIATHPHDSAAYTQGLEFLDGQLVESTGLVGQSSLRLVDPDTGQVIESVSVDEPLFAEGATVVDGEIWQLTWRAGLLLIYSDDLVLTGNITYDGEGWGLCALDEYLAMSDGSDRLIFRDRRTFEVISSIAVTNDGQPVENINELECVDGVIWANIWQSPELIAIEPNTGQVVGTVDLEPLLPPEYDEDNNVANGIAYDQTSGHFWLTGKRWSVIYEVDLQPIS